MRTKSNLVVGLIRNFTGKYPEGMQRVILLGDPSKDLGAIAEPECRRIVAALELAQAKQIPAGVVHPLGGRQDIDAKWRGEHGLDRSGSAEDR